MSGYFKKQKKRQQNKAAIFIVFSVFIFLFFSVGAYLLISADTLFGNSVSPSSVVVRESVPEYKTAKVLVPVQDIVQSQELKVEMFREVERPTIGLPTQSISSFEEVHGYFSKTLLLADQPFTKAHLSDKDLNSAISPRIPPGFRAITINVDNTTSVEGWALPGSIVDVLWTTSIRGEESIVTIVENAKVLSTGGALEKRDPNAPPANTTTLLVKSKDAQKIILAQKTGGLSLALRGLDDEGASDGGGSISKESLHGGTGAVEDISPGVNGTLVIDGQKYVIKSNGEMVPL